MLQAYSFPCFSSPLRKLPQEQGSFTSLQLPVKQIKITNRNQQNKHFTWFCQKVSASTACFSSGDSEQTGKHKQLGRIFSGTSDDGLVEQRKEDRWKSFQSDVWRQWDALYRFCRPYALIGTMIPITSVSLLPLGSIGDLSPTFFVGLLKALIPSFFITIYVSGINQLFDVEIDKINKPYLPLATGEYSMATGMAIVTASAIMSLATAIMFQSPPLVYTMLIWGLFGSAYSIELPFLRWKRNVLLTATVYIVVRAFTIHIAFFFHMQKYVLGNPIVFTRSLGFAVAIMCFFNIVMLLLKDIPDMDGDRQHGIQSLSIKIGQKRVFWLCIRLLLIAYGGAVVAGASSSFLLSKLVTVLGHCTLATILWMRAQSVNLKDNASISTFYIFVWKLYCAEYVLIPFVR